jgi:tetratricopeptide (TPR) repeat protein
LKSLPNNLLGKIGAMGLLSVLVFSMFSYPEDVLLLKIATVLCLAIIPNTNNFLLQIKITQNRMIWAKILIVGVAVGFFFLYYQQVQSFAQGLVFWKKATTAYQGQQYDTAIENYQKAYPVLKNNGTYLVAYGKALQIHEKPDKAIVILTKASQYLQNTILHTALGNAYEQQNKFAKAEAAYKKAQEMIPHRFYAPYLLAKLYIAQGDLKNAEKASRNIFEKKEKVHSAAVREIRFELQNALRALQQKVEATASQASLPLPSPIKKGGMQN